MKVFHTTSAAAARAIIARGFRDGTGGYMLASLVLTGVFVADSPLGVNEGCKGEDVLVVHLPDDQNLDQFELVEDGKPYREWCVPAALLNSSGRTEVFTEPD